MTDPTAALNLIVGGLLVTIFFLIFLRIVDAMQNKSEKYILAHVALGNGLLLALGLSPLGTLTYELVELAPLYTRSISATANGLLKFATGLNLLFGGLFMYKSSEWWGVVGFGMAFISGYLIPFYPVLGFLGWVFSPLFTSVSTTSRW